MHGTMAIVSRIRWDGARVGVRSAGRPSAATLERKTEVQRHR